jgi:hypothetical protein
VTRRHHRQNHKLSPVRASHGLRPPLSISDLDPGEGAEEVVGNQILQIG